MAAFDGSLDGGPDWDSLGGIGERCGDSGGVSDGDHHRRRDGDPEEESTESLLETLTGVSTVALTEGKRRSWWRPQRGY